jgi:predicted nucleotidyltransferase/uncharacterized protein (UPF0332 family)
MAQTKEKNLQDLKQKIEEFKKEVLEKYEEYILGIGLMPPNKEKQEDINILLLVDDFDSTKMDKEELKQKLQKLYDELAQKISKNLKPHLVLGSEMLQNCYDSKPEIQKMIASSATLYDKGLFSAMKVGEIHKSMVVERFEKYIVSYVLAGSIVTDKANKDSDIDAFIIIDDTDVKKMSRAELKDKLRAIIVGMAAEARQLAETNREFHIQVYILTDFWENVKEANPVIFTFLRDGVPLYDRGTFMPWKHLLKMGKIKPSPEAIEMMMHTGDQFLQRIKLKLKEIGMEDFHWALTTVSQAALMLYGLPPPTPKETAGVLREVFVKKAKIFSEENVKIYEKVYNLRKKLEHGTKKEITGKELDELYKEASKYLEEMKKLFEKIEINKEKENITKTSEDLMQILKELYKTEDLELKEKDYLKDFKKEFVDTNKLPVQVLNNLKDFEKAKKEFESKKHNKQEMNKAIMIARSTLRILIEYIQRTQNKKLEQSKIRIKAGDDVGEIIFTEKGVLLVLSLENSENIYAIEQIKEKYQNPKQIKDVEPYMSSKLVRSKITKGLIEKIQTLYKEEIQLIMD